VDLEARRSPTAKSDGALAVEEGIEADNAVVEPVGRGGGGGGE
jgi:hypothetical protein